MKIFVTKYALTEGIEEFDFPNENKDDDGYFSYTERDPWRHHFYTKSEWFTSRDDAVVDANKRVARKIASVKKQMARLEALKF